MSWGREPRPLPRWQWLVKIVAIEDGARRTIREYGPSGELLRSTVQL